MPLGAVAARGGIIFNGDVGVETLQRASYGLWWVLLLCDYFKTFSNFTFLWTPTPSVSKTKVGGAQRGLSTP